MNPPSYDPREVTAVLARLERPLGPSAVMIACESQLFRGLLVADDARIVFLCRRFGGWEVLVDVAGPALRDARVLPSFTGLRHELRVAVAGHTHRFGDLGEEDALALVLVLRGERRAAQQIARSAPTARRRPQPPPIRGEIVDDINIVEC